MAKMSVKQFMKDAKKEGNQNSDIMNLKETGKLVVWLHPATGIETRKTAYLPTIKEVEVKKGKKTITEEQLSGKMIVLSENYDDCPIRQLVKALRDDDSLDDDDVVMEVMGEEYLKGDIIGTEGYDWKKRIKTNIEYLFGAVDNADVAKGVQVLIATKSLGKAITKVIENQMEQAQEDEGDADLGDPFENPFAMKLNYDKEEQASLMYGAQYHKAKLKDDIEELLETEELSLSGFTTPTDVNEICDILEDFIVAEVAGYDLEDFRTEEEAPKKEDKKASKKSSKKASKKDEEEEDDEEEEAPKKSKKASKKSSKKASKKDEEEEDDEEEEEEEEVPKKSKKASKKSSKKATKKVVEEEDEEDEEDEEEEEKESKKKSKKSSKDIKKKSGKSSTKGKKTSKVEEDEEDEEDEEEEEEAPKKSSKKSSKKKDKPKKQVEQCECPACGELVDEDAEECPECGADFDEESIIICPKCGTENDEDSSECSKCKESLMPF